MKIPSNMSVNALVGYSILLIVIAFSSILGNFLIKNIRTTNNNTNIISNNNMNTNIIPIPSEYPDYVAIKGEKKDPDIIKLELFNNKSDEFGAVEGDSSTLGGTTFNLTVTGSLSRAYLFFEGTIDELPLSAFDDLYFLVNNFYGGHIINDDNSLPTPPGDTTKILLDLRSVSYYPTIVNKRQETNKRINISLFDQFIDGKDVVVYTFISSERSPRVYNELSIYYECENESDCKIVKN